MKQKDLVVIVVIVFIAAVASFIISKSLFAAPKDRQQQVITIQSISSQLQPPDPAYFNSNSKDITQFITISQSNNQSPF